MSTQPWRLHEWLPELLMSWTQQVLGLAGVAWLLPLGAAAIALTLWLATRPRAPLLATAAVTSVALVAHEPEPVAATAPGVLRPRRGVPAPGWLRAATVDRAGGSSRDVGLGLQHGMWFFGVVIGVGHAPRHLPRPGRRTRRSGFASPSCPSVRWRRRP